MHASQKNTFAFPWCVNWSWLVNHFITASHDGDSDSDDDFDICMSLQAMAVSY